MNSDDWLCGACAFRNIGTLRACDMCDAPKPDHRPRPPLGPLPAQPAVVASPAKRRPSPAARAAAPAPADAAESSQTTTDGSAPASAPAPAPAPAPEPAPAAVPAPAPAPPPAPPPAAAASAPSALDPPEVLDADDFPWSGALARANETFGGAPLRTLQRRAVNAAMRGEDVLVLLPTGAGKSRCFQLPALASQGLTLVVAPLLSLIDDQVAALAQYGVRALHLSSTLAPAEAADVLDALRPSRVASTILYATPERLQHNLRLGAALDLLHARGKLARIVVDEVRRVT